MKILNGKDRYIGATDRVVSVNTDLQRTTNIFKPDVYSEVVSQMEWFNNERNNSDDFLVYGKLEVLADSFLTAIDAHVTANTKDSKISVGYCDRLLPLTEGLVTINKVVDTSIIVNKDRGELFDGDIVGLFHNGEITITKILTVSEYSDLEYRVDLDLIKMLDTSYSLIPPICEYYRHFKVIYDTDYMKIFKSGYSTNIFNEQIYQFNSYKNINASGLVNNLGLPIDGLILKLGITDITSYNVFGEHVIDKIAYNLNDLSYTVVSPALESFAVGTTLFKFEPYKEIKTRTYSNVLVNTDEEQIFEIPDYAFKFFDGSIYFRRLMNKGEFETDNGLEYPFINGIHYLYSDLKFYIRRMIPIADYTSYKDVNVEYNQDAIGDTKNTRLC